jgi:hypothetical protein
MMHSMIFITKSQNTTDAQLMQGIIQWNEKNKLLVCFSFDSIEIFQFFCTLQIEVSEYSFRLWTSTTSERYGSQRLCCTSRNRYRSIFLFTKFNFQICFLSNEIFILLILISENTIGKKCEVFLEVNIQSRYCPTSRTTDASSSRKCTLHIHWIVLSCSLFVFYWITWTCLM